MRVYIFFFRKKHWKDESDLTEVGAQMWRRAVQKGQSRIALCVFFCIVLTFESFWVDGCIRTVTRNVHLIEKITHLRQHWGGCKSLSPVKGRYKARIPGTLSLITSPIASQENYLPRTLSGSIPSV